MNPRFLDTLMEKLVVPSFSRIGVRARRRLYDWPVLEDYDLTDKVVVLTGGTSGIGRAAAELYAALGATLVIVARNPDKTTQLIAQLQASTGNRSLHTVIGDLGEQEDVHRIADEIAAHFDSVDVLAHNAGALFNQRQRASNGTDLCVELMVATPFLLTGLLLPQLQPDVDGDTGFADGETDQVSNQGSNREHRWQHSRAPGRVLTMSSGGMYTQGLTVDELEMKDSEYQGAKQYARAKRAQVVLNELWSQQIERSKVVFHSLHPGWVDTPGIIEALPGFSRILSPLGLLRTAREGADTLVWLSADNQATQSTGRFWHDRAIRPIDLSANTGKADTAERRQQLWQWCESQTGWKLK